MLFVSMQLHWYAEYGLLFAWLRRLPARLPSRPPCDAASMPPSTAIASKNNSACSARVLFAAPQEQDDSELDLMDDVVIMTDLADGDKTTEAQVRSQFIQLD